MPVGQCALCLQTKDLRDSHLLPAATYKYLHGSGRVPVLITNKGRQNSSKQVHQHLLCAVCEDRFNRLGEKWMLANMALPRGFQLQQRLMAAAPIFTVNQVGADVFNAANILGTDLDRLIYFAVSVFWRASVCTWYVPDSDEEVHIDLGPYRDGLRTFLLGTSPFPQHVGVIVSVEQGTPVTGAFAPFRESKNGFHNFVFYIPGVEFQLNVGKTTPTGVRALSIQVGPGHPIFLTSALSTRVANVGIDFLRESKKRSRVK